MEETNNVQDEKIEELLSVYDEHRAAIKDMITDLEAIKERIDTLIPMSLDARYMRFFEEKVKSITGLFNSLLDMRKEIAKSVKDEIDIRRRIKSADEEFDFEDLLDIREMTDKIDQFKKEKDQIQKKRIKENSEQTIDKDIDIPGITSRVEGQM